MLGRAGTAIKRLNSTVRQAGFQRPGWHAADEELEQPVPGLSVKSLQFAGGASAKVHVEYLSWAGHGRRGNVSQRNSEHVRE